ncbi:MAG: hypothetical protein HC821_05735 [Lewinella sp.]|nr:hypothetical protein [Lewinella sp.]
MRRSSTNMLQHFHLLTLTYRQSSLKDIGQFVANFDPDGQTETRLHALREELPLEELCYLATCNRVVFFFTTRATVDAAFVSHFLALAQATEQVEALLHYQGTAAVAHLFEVASSVDSLVVGERQILGQLREAYENCRRWGVNGR